MGFRGGGQLDPPLQHILVSSTHAEIGLRNMKNVDYSKYLYSLKSSYFLNMSG